MRLSRSFTAPSLARWAGVALLACSVLPMQAQAANVVTKTEDLGTIVVPAALTFSHVFTLPTPGFDAAADTFYDDYVFSVASSSFSSLTATIDLGNVFSINNLQVRLYSGTASTGPVGAAILQPWTTPTGTGSTVVITPTQLGAGNYILEVRGNVTGAAGGSYVGAMNFASVSAVPEGDGLAFIAAGLSAMLCLRARKQSKK